MKKLRATTIQQKLGFFDDDLKKPKHDELMLWLDENIQRILNEKIPTDLTVLFSDNFKYYVEQEIQKAIEFCERRANKENSDIYKKKIKNLKNLDLFGNPYMRNSDVKIHKKTWEYPLSSQNKQRYRYGNKFVVGFIDLMVSYSKPVYPRLIGISKNNSHYDGEEFITDVNDEIFISFEEEHKTIFIEVKTEIKSLGELIRQINLYKEHQPGDYFVLCPDDKYKKKLFEQRIYFIDYDRK